MNWAVGREYLDRTPFRRGTEALIRKLQEDNRRRHRISEDEEARLLAFAPPFLRSMIITALDTGMRLGEMLALRFGWDQSHMRAGAVALKLGTALLFKLELARATEFQEHPAALTDQSRRCR